MSDTLSEFEIFDTSVAFAGPEAPRAVFLSKWKPDAQRRIFAETYDQWRDRISVSTLDPERWIAELSQSRNAYEIAVRRAGTSLARVSSAAVKFTLEIAALNGSDKGDAEAVWDAFRTGAPAPVGATLIKTLDLSTWFDRRDAVLERASMLDAKRHAIEYLLYRILMGYPLPNDAPSWPPTMSKEEKEKNILAYWLEERKTAPNKERAVQDTIAWAEIEYPGVGVSKATLHRWARDHGIELS